MSLKKASSSLVSRSRVGFTPTGGGAAVTISNVIVTDSSWNNLDDTAVGTSSSYIKINGSGFVVNPSVYIGTTQVSSGSITFVSSTELRVVLPSLSLGTQNLFVFNTDYSGAIWSAGLVVSGFPDYTQTTYTSSTPLSVSVQLLATGDAPLTYALQGGSSLPAGTSLSSSGLITGTTTDGTYQFTVIVSDAQNQSFQQQLTLTITSTDQYFNRTVLAINADTDTFVRDASSNSFAITVNGDTKPSAFSPYNTNWSNYFDGTGDYLSIAANSAFNIGASESFTVECWIYSTYTANIQTIFNICDTGSLGYGSARVQIKANQGFQFLAGPGGSWQVNIEQGTYTLGTWTHVAFVRNVNTFLCFVNGQQVGTATYSNALVQDRNTFIGFNSGTAYPVNGYISNFRFVKGTALYTATFTPPTTALTAVSNTQLLTCQSNRLIDNSTNAFAITKAGDTKVSAFGPFTETDTTTGSGYYDGTGDYLTIPYNSAWDFGTGNFTIETWLYPTTSGTARVIASSFISGGNDGWSWELTNGNLLTFYAEGAFVVTSSLAISSNKWTHIAVSRSGSTLKLFVDGVESGTATYSTSIAGFSGLLAISATSTGVAPFVGYQSNFRLVKGTAVYTSAFTPPTTPLTAIANTSLLTLQGRRALNNHTFIDGSENFLVVTRGGNTSQGSFSPFSPAGWSNYFDGTGDYLSLSARSFAGDFTLEAWIYPLRFADSNGSSILFCSTSPNNQVALAASGVTTYYNGSTSISSGTGRIVLNTWQHYAICRSGTTTRIFVNGVLVASNLSDSGTRTFTFIGQFPDGNNYHFQGYMSNVRWATTARYTAAFTPPSSILSSDANTSLLTCQSNRFIDNSTNNFTITKNGDTKVVNFSPFAPTAAYSPETHGASAYFDGTGDYLTLASNVLPDISGVFTYECWVYLINGAAAQIFGCWNNNAGGWGLFVSDNTSAFNGRSIVWYFGNYGSNESYRGVDSVAMTNNAWNHIAVVRNASNVWAFYVNGIARATTVFGSGLSWLDSRNFTDGNPVGIGQLNATPAQCYISDARLVIGNAVYTANFTPPTAPLTKIGGTNLLLNFNSGGIIDSTSRNVLECVGDAKIVTSTRKYGTGSMYFDGTGDYLTSSATPNLDMGAGDWTVEGWVYVVTRNSNYPLIISNNNGGFTAGALALTVSNADNASYNDRFVLAAYDLGGTRLLVANTTNNFNTWYHFAVVRNGTNLTIYRNGISLATTTISAAFTFDWGKLGLRIGGGNWDGINGTYNGYIDDLRITKGYARYTANFTPPTATFLAQ